MTRRALLAALLLLSRAAVADCDPDAQLLCPTCFTLVCEGNDWTCEVDASQNGSSCFDANRCHTGNAFCSNGICTHDGSVVCQALDQCHSIGTCSPSTGFCGNPVKTDGTSCNHGDAFTINESCQSGICSAGTFCRNASAATCPSSRCQQSGVCDASTQSCAYSSACPFTVQISKVDAFGAAFDPGVTVTTSPATDTVAVSITSQSIPVAAGIYTVSSTSPANYNPAVSVNGGSFVAGSSASVTISADASVAFRYAKVAGFALTYPVSSNSGTPAALSVRALDAFGALVPSYAGTVHVISSDAAAILPADFQFNPAIDQGVKMVTVTLQTPASGVSITATDAALGVTGTQAGINVAGALPPTWPAGATLTATSVQATSADLSWTAANDNGALAQYEIFDNGLVIKTLPASTLTAHLEGLAPNSSHVFHVEAGDSAGNWSTTGPSTTSIVLPHIVITPPPLATDVETNFVQQTLFIYTVVAGSPSPVQIGMTGGSIDPARVAVIRGVVWDVDGHPVPDVPMVSIGHPEYGHTYTRADGAYDLAVNGGDTYVVDFERTGFLGIHRTVKTAYHEFTNVDDVTMLRIEASSSSIDSSGAQAAAQVATGPVVDDGDGPRHPLIVFPPGTTAIMTTAAGPINLSTMTIHATEYTNGAVGPSALPGNLPPSSAYTYAIALMSDEAEAAAASNITFSQPVWFYLDNFIGFPVGEPVPAGYYDRDDHVWVAWTAGW